MNLDAHLQKAPRRFLPESFQLTTWEALEPYLIALRDREIRSRDELESWMKDLSELEAVVSEDACWRQIRMTCDTTDKSLEEAFAYFSLEIQPKLQTYAQELNLKLVESPYLAELDPQRYQTYLRSVRKAIELFRAENVDLQARLNVLLHKYGQITGAMTIEVQGREYTLQQAARFLEQPDRALREEVFHKTAERRLQAENSLDELYTELVSGRDQVARNAGFANYRDYRFQELGRFDYGKEACFAFHEAIREHVMPLAGRIMDRQQRRLGLDRLRPWDSEAEPAGVRPLEPFADGAELVAKAEACFRELRPYFGDCLEVMREMGRLDLDSRKGKAPGGYNCPLAETGVPFIFMNAAGQMKDVTTIVHEGGHAIHSFLSHPLELSAFKEYPMEMAELASMSMELFSMDHWEVFFSDPKDLRRAKIQQLERVISIFPWIATIDKFQHWVYEHPAHSLADRRKAWMDILETYSTGAVDWSGFEHYREISWQRQLHLYEVPFYYIEYGIAQLGALAMWRQYTLDPSGALDRYMKALSLGSTCSLPELYEAAGIRFDFSGPYVKELMDFATAALQRLWDEEA